MTPKPSHQPPSQETIDAFVRIVGEEHAIRDEDAMAPYLVEWRDRYRGKAALVLRPGETEQVSAILKRANETRTAIVPQGGNTGLVGGQIPFESGHEVLVALECLNRVRDIDLASNTMTVEAGLVLALAQQVAASAGRLFPLSLASEGSCQIGGVLATNAGGTAVLAYGSARDLALGLEVVLADGTRVERAQVAAQGQFGLRPQGPVHRLRRHARHHHRCRAATLSQACRAGDLHDRPVAARGCARLLRPRAGAAPGRHSPPSRSCRASGSTSC